MFLLIHQKKKPSQRSYNKDLFSQAIHRMVNANIKTQIEIERFQLLADKVESIVQQKDELDIDFSNAPDEFKGILLLKLMNEIMHI
jgi:hypothetical protein